MRNKDLIKPVAVIALLAFVMVGILSMPVIASQEQKEEQKITELTMEQAIEMAEKHDADIQKADINKEKTRIDLKKARDLRKKVKKYSPYIGYSYQSLLAERVAPDVEERKYELAATMCDVSIRAAKLKVISYYYKLQKAEGNLNIVRDKAQRTRDALDIVEAKYKVGTAAKLEVDQQKVEVAKADADVVSAEQAVQDTNLKLNKCLGLPVDMKVKAVSPVELLEYEIKFDSALERAMKDDLELLTAELQAFAAELIKNEAASVYSTQSNDYKLASQDYIEACINMEQANYDVNQKVLNASHLYENMQRLYNILSSQAAVADENARLIKCSYEVGVATLYDLNEASDTAAEVKQKLQEAIFGYNIAVNQFKLGIYPPANN